MTWSRSPDSRNSTHRPLLMPREYVAETYDPAVLNLSSTTPVPSLNELVGRRVDG